METENFSFTKLKTIYEREPEINIKDKIYRKVSEETKKYILKYFYICTNGDYYFWHASINQFDIHNEKTLNTVYLNTFPSEVKKWFISENTARYNIVCDTHKSLIDGDSINMYKGIMHPKICKYDTVNKETKKKIELFLSYILEVICGDDKNVFNYVIKWMSNMIKGNKNDTVLYLKGEEGIGKSTMTDFLHNHVLGKNICSKSARNSDALRGSFNKILCGQLLVVFEELPNFSEKEWEGISSILKDLVTNDVTHYADKYEKAVKCRNINNYIINTNVDAIKHSEGRRYFILPISSKRKGDLTYCGELKKECFNDKVGEAFYYYLLDIDTKNFYAQDMPETKNKLDAIVDRLDLVFKFIKDEYILRKKSINCLLKSLFDAYIEYCTVHDRKPITKIKFSNKLSEINIQSKKSHGQVKYDVSLEELNAIAHKNKWMHFTDEQEEDNTDEDFDNDVDKSDKSVNVNLFLLEENRKMKNELEELRKEIERMKCKPKTEEEKRPNKKTKTVVFEDEIIDMVNLLK